MVIGTPDGMSYEDEMHHELDIPSLTQSPNYDPKTDVYQRPPEGEQASTQGLAEPKEVHIVRHGETTANDNDTVRGTHIPITLNETGKKEAEKASEDLKEKGVDTLVSSPLLRARQTAEIIGKKLGVTPQYDSRLATWDVGEHEGKPCETSNPILEKYAEHRQDEAPTGGESFNDFTNRSFAGIRDAVLNNKDKNLAIITHNRVEATLRGWQKTGQDNPDIDYKEVVKESTPGNVRTIQFQPDATILQPGPTVGEDKSDDMRTIMPWHLEEEPDLKTSDMHIEPYSKKDEVEAEARDAQTARESAAARTRASVMGYLGYAPDLNEPTEVTSERLFRKLFPERFDPNIHPSIKYTEEPKDIRKEGGDYTPISDKQINPTMKSMRDAVVDHIMNMSEETVKSLHDLLTHPENLVGTGELGGIAKYGAKTGMTRIISGAMGGTKNSIWNHPEMTKRLLKLKEEGKSMAEIAKELGVTRNQVAGRLNRIKPTEVDKTQPFTPETSGAEGDSEFERELEKYMQNPSQQQQGKAVSDYNLVKVNRTGWESTEPFAEQSFEVRDAQGNHLTNINLSEHDEGKDLVVSWIGKPVSITDNWTKTSKANANIIGPRGIRSILKQIKEMFPKAERLMGMRTSGARLKAGSGSDDASIDLK